MLRAGLSKKHIALTFRGFFLRSVELSSSWALGGNLVDNSRLLLSTEYKLKFWAPIYVHSEPKLIIKFGNCIQISFFVVIREPRILQKWGDWTLRFFEVTMVFWQIVQRIFWRNFCLSFLTKLKTIFLMNFIFFRQNFLTNFLTKCLTNFSWNIFLDLLIFLLLQALGSEFLWSCFYLGAPKELEFPNWIINFGSQCLLLRRKWSKNWTWSRISQQQQNGASGVPNTHISSFSHEFKHRVCSATTKSYNWSQYNIWNSNRNSSRPFKILKVVPIYLKNQLTYSLEYIY